MIFEKKWKDILLCILFSFLFLPLGCSTLKQPVETKPLFHKDAAQILSYLKGQNSNVESFQGIGRVIVNSGSSELESNLFIAGKSPQRARLEITHFWGKPLIHIVIDGRDVSALSLTEKKFFRCHDGYLDIDHIFLSKLDTKIIWDILAGRVPILDEVVKTVGYKENEILLLNSSGQIIERILFSSNPILAKEIYFPLKEITINLSKFRKMNSGYVPLKIEIIEEKPDRAIKIEYKDFEIGNQIPDEIFYLSPLPGYEVIEISKGLKIY